MRTLFITQLLVLFCQVLHAQGKTEVFYGMTGRNDVAADIIELYDIGYCVSGGFEGNNSYYRGWNIKTDVNLEMVYDKVFEHDLSTVAIFASVSDKNGNIYITGFTTYPVSWPFISKIDSCGQYQWCKILNYEDEFNFGWSSDIVINENNEIILLVSLSSDELIDKVHLIGLNESGEVLWKKPYASKYDYPLIDNPSGYSIKEINKDYYISGYCYWPYPDDPDHVFLRPLFIGIDSLFNEKWILPYYALDSVYGDAFRTVPLNDSVFMGVGVRRAANSANEDNAILMFYNSNGEELGFNDISNDQIGPDIQGSGIDNIVRINDNLFMAASQFGPDFSANPLGELVIDTSGNIYHLQSRPNTIASSPGLIKTYDNNYVIATSIDENKGDTDIYLYKIDENLNDVPFDPTPHNYDSLCPGGIESGTIDLSDCLVWTSIGDAPSPAEYYESVKWVPIKAWPNPSGTGKVSFGFENTGYFAAGAAAAYAPPSVPPNGGENPALSGSPPYPPQGGRQPHLAIFNIVGEQVHSERIYRFQKETTVDTQSWEKGMYFAVVYNKGKVVGKCKFVLR